MNMISSLRLQITWPQILILILSLSFMSLVWWQKQKLAEHLNYLVDLEEELNLTLTQMNKQHQRHLQRVLSGAIEHNDNTYLAILNWSNEHYLDDFTSLFNKTLTSLKKVKANPAYHHLNDDIDRLTSQLERLKTVSTEINKTFKDTLELLKTRQKLKSTPALGTPLSEENNVALPLPPLPEPHPLLSWQIDTLDEALLYLKQLDTTWQNYFQTSKNMLIYLNNAEIRLFTNQPVPETILLILALWLILALFSIWRSQKPAERLVSLAYGHITKPNCLEEKILLEQFAHLKHKIAELEAELEINKQS